MIYTPASYDGKMVIAFHDDFSQPDILIQNKI